MLQKLSTKWNFTISKLETGYEILLFEIEGIRSKKFFLANVPSVERLTDHMNSLTDELCEAFIPKVREKKEKKREI